MMIFLMWYYNDAVIDNDYDYCNGHVYDDQDDDDNYEDHLEEYYAAYSIIIRIKTFGFVMEMRRRRVLLLMVLLTND